MAESLARQAEQLLGLWSTLSMQHVALGAACACGMGGVSLRLDDFEIDIVDYLEDAGQRSEIAEVVAFFSARQSAQSEGRTLGRVIRRVALHPLVQLLEDVQEERMPPAVADWLVQRIRRTLNSYAEQHGISAG